MDFISWYKNLHVRVRYYTSGILKTALIQPA